MRKYKWLLVILLLISGYFVYANSVVSPEALDECYYVGEWYRITTQFEPGIALHPAPTKDSDILTDVPYDSEIYVEYIYGKYGYTNYAGDVGCLNVGEHAITVNTDDNLYQYQWYYISTDYDPRIALHPIPAKASETIGSIPYLSTFFVEKIEGDYGYTVYDGCLGWINIRAHGGKIADPTNMNNCSYVGKDCIVEGEEIGVAMHHSPQKYVTILTRVPNGTEVHVEYVCGNYGYCNYKGRAGLDRITTGEYC